MASKLLSSLFLTSLSAVSASRYATYDYDLTTPQFTPDGRLLQVEYATNACVREGSNPILSVGFDDGDDAIIVMATTSSDASSGTLYNDKDIADGQVNQRAQYRIIEVPVAASYNQLMDGPDQISAITTSTILVGLSGHLSDANSLLQTIYSQLEEEQSSFGWHRLGVAPVGHDPNKSGGLTASTTTETAIRLARAAADQCQKHAFGGGLRPIGASLLLCAADMQQRQGRVAMCKTDPSGGINSMISNMKESVAPKVMISGGSSKSQAKLQTLIESRLRDLYRTDRMKDENHIKKVLQTVLLSLIEEWKSRHESIPASSSLSKLYKRIAGVDNSKEKSRFPQMEVVFASSRMGSFRLSGTDICALLESQPDDN